MGALFSHLCAQARSSRHRLRPRARRQHAGRGGGAGAVRRAAGAAACGAEARVCCAIVAGLPVLQSPRAAGARAAPGLVAWLAPASSSRCAVLGAAAALRRRARGRPRRELPRRRASAAVSVVEDAAGVSRLRIDNRQQEGSSATRAGRRAPGAAAAAAAPGAAAGAVPGPGHRRHRGCRRREDREPAGRRGRAAARGHRSVSRHFTQPPARRRHALRGCT